MPSHHDKDFRRFLTSDHEKSWQLLNKKLFFLKFRFFFSFSRQQKLQQSVQCSRKAQARNSDLVMVTKTQSQNSNPLNSTSRMSTRVLLSRRDLQQHQKIWSSENRDFVSGLLRSGTVPQLSPSRTRYTYPRRRFPSRLIPTLDTIGTSFGQNQNSGKISKYDRSSFLDVLANWRDNFEWYQST